MGDSGFSSSVWMDIQVLYWCLNWREYYVVSQLLWCISKKFTLDSSPPLDDSLPHTSYTKSTSRLFIKVMLVVRFFVSHLWSLTFCGGEKRNKREESIIRRKKRIYMVVLLSWQFKWFPSFSKYILNSVWAAFGWILNRWSV